VGAGTSEGRAGALRYGSFPLVVLACTLALENGERLSLAQALDGIQDDFGVSDTALGVLGAVVTLFGIIGAIPIGVLTDRMKRTTLLAGAMAIWTVCIGFNALAPSFVFLLIARLGVGMVEANSPAAFSLMSDYYPVASRARMMGRYQMGSAVGGAIGIGTSGLLVDSYGWRAAFWVWVPLGAVVVFLLTRLPEPRRGDQDRAFHAESVTGFDVDGVPGTAFALALPLPARTSDLDYSSASSRQVLKELLRIRSMWFGVLSLTISQFLLVALGHWGIEFFKRAHDLSSAEATAFAPAIGAGAALGLIGGGAIADRLLQKGHVNARVYVASASSVAAAALLAPAVLTNSLPVAAVLLFLGTTCLTIPIAPSEAIVSDVVPSELRGRAASVRAIVRSVAALSPLIVGVLSDATDLSTALALLTPMYAIGGVLMLFAARSYPSDLAFVAAESRRSVEKETTE
jgi:predicted MFS family arabinose efflux permease